METIKLSLTSIERWQNKYGRIINKNYLFKIIDTIYYYKTFNKKMVISKQLLMENSKDIKEEK